MPLVKCMSIPGKRAGRPACSCQAFNQHSLVLVRIITYIDDSEPVMLGPSEWLHGSGSPLPA